MDLPEICNANVLSYPKVWQRSVSRAQLKKEVVVAAFRLCKSLDTRQKRWWVPGTAGSCLTNDSDKNGESPIQRASVQHKVDRQVRMEKKASWCTLLRRTTRLKCVNSRVKSSVKCYSLERDSPKDSCHLVKPTWGIHLYRKAIRIHDLECNVRAKNKQKQHGETNEYVYIYKKKTTQWTLTV